MIKLKSQVKKLLSATDGKSSLTEIIFVMLIFLIFSVMVFTLVVTGSGAYDRLKDSREMNADTRTALSYIAMKVRQSDKDGVIKTAKNPRGDDHGNAILIEDIVGKMEFQTWIFSDGTNLMEARIKKGTDMSRIFGFEMSKCARLDASLDNASGALKIETKRDARNDDSRESIELFLRSKR